MKRDWKPGDVADLTYTFADGGRGIRVKGDYCPKEHPNGDHWHFGAGTYGDGSGAQTIRPLVVIDPEDREQVALILSHYHSWKWTADIAEASITDMQNALREFANPQPPKPECPSGLGAVVEDDKGQRWVHFETKTGWWWRNERGQNLRWFDLAAVRVLSEGVRP